jgi:excisionase family DNA binding protein
MIMPEQAGELLTIDQAATRLGVYPGTIRRRLKRGEIKARRGNRGQWLVELPPNQTGDSPPSRAPASAEAELVAELRRAIQRLEQELRDAKEREQRLLTMLNRATERLAAERQPAPRPWPGLKAWWRRVWEGEE